MGVVCSDKDCSSPLPPVAGASLFHVSLELLLSVRQTPPNQYLSLCVGLLLISAAFTLTSSPQTSSCHQLSLPTSSSFFFSCHFGFWSEWISVLGLAALYSPHGMHSKVLLCNSSPETPIALVSNKCVLISIIISTNCCSCVSQISVSESSRNIFLIIEAETLPNSVMRPSLHLYWETRALTYF